MYKSFHHKTSLDDLPFEIIPQVASYLDLEDIFSLQQTTKKIRGSINVPVVWRALTKTYSARHFHIYQPQSGRFDDLTDHELHKWIRKRLAFDRIWRAPTVQPRLRALTVDRYLTIGLVPGGRWLLAGSLAGSIWYFNLDSEKPERRALIQPSEDIEGSEGDISGIEIYTDQNTSGLYFNLAIRTEGYPSPIETEWLHVWQIKIEDGDSLTAKWMTSVPTYGFSCSIAIGRHVVVRTRNQARNHALVEIYWWKRCSATDLLVSYFLALGEPHITYMIGGDRILCADMGGGFNLYDIPEPEHIRIRKNLAHDDIPSPKPIWSYTLSKAEGVNYSPLYHDSTTYRFTISSGDGIWGFTIPASREHTPSITRLSTYFDSRTICVPGLYKAFALYNINRSGVRIGYGWESGDDRRTAMAYSRGELKGTQLCDISQPSFDEESGRLVYHRQDKVIILDFLHPQYQNLGFSGRQ